MRTEMLNGGWFSTPIGIWRRGDDMEQKMCFPVPAYLIETADERILVDTGLHPGAVADPTKHYAGAHALGLFELGQEAGVADQVDLETITKVVLTHLHFDHVGGLRLMPRSVPIFVQRAEWEAAHDATAAAKNFFLPVDYAGLERQIRLVDGDHDLLGDGSIQLLSTPGHTPGHQSVQVGERLVIGGDVTHFASGLDDGRFPVVGHDFDAQAQSADRLRALRDGGAVVLPGHDPQVLKPGPVVL